MVICEYERIGDIKAQTQGNVVKICGKTVPICIFEKPVINFSLNLPNI